MTKTIFLYIGMGKSGSTSIQNFLFKNRFFLEKKNFFSQLLKKGRLMKISKKELDEFLFEETHPVIAKRKSVHHSNEDDDWFDATIEAFEQGDNINNEESEFES